MDSDGTQGETGASQRLPGYPISDQSRISRRKALGRISAVAGAGAVAWVVPEIFIAKPAAGTALSGPPTSGGTGGSGGGGTGGSGGGGGTGGSGGGGGPADRAAAAVGRIGRRRQRWRRIGRRRQRWRRIGWHRRIGRRRIGRRQWWWRRTRHQRRNHQRQRHVHQAGDHRSHHHLPRGSPRFHGPQSPARRRDRRGADRRRVGHAVLGQPLTERAADVVTPGCPRAGYLRSGD